jgi:hypothetical protein
MVSPAKIRKGAVRYPDSTNGTSSFSKKSRNRSAPPLVGALESWEGERSRVRSVFLTPTTMTSGMKPFRARN